MKHWPEKLGSIQLATFALLAYLTCRASRNLARSILKVWVSFSRKFNFLISFAATISAARSFIVRPFEIGDSFVVIGHMNGPGRGFLKFSECGSTLALQLTCLNQDAFEIPLEWTSTTMLTRRTVGDLIKTTARS